MSLKASQNTNHEVDGVDQQNATFGSTPVSPKHESEPTAGTGLPKLDT